MVKASQYAGFWLRFIAGIIDLAILSLLLSGFSVILFLLSAPDILTTFSSILLTWLYFALMESSIHQATVGKIAVGLKVTDMNGKMITFLKATERYFGKYLSWFIFGIGFLMIAFTKKKQGLHDLIAKCLVLKKD
ncbi:MAG: RDD family protein [Nanoarchaeota archaeon]|nr:RDD family protein [Nanoarchaeota archaeon]